MSMPMSFPPDVSAPARILELQGHRHGRFQLVLHGSRLCLEGWCEEPGQAPWQCSAWLQPFDAPGEVAHRLLQRPSCCLSPVS
jgi:hypothetical protein